ncbi:hypothetical protein VCR3J2_530052 [Vibrio coralliirubri]|nr:hypothetical protein VCR3J2_530052 [Vibrio coralliirubri]
MKSYSFKSDEIERLLVLINEIPTSSTGGDFSIYTPITYEKHLNGLCLLFVYCLASTT